MLNFRRLINISNIDIIIVLSFFPEKIYYLKSFRQIRSAKKVKFISSDIKSPMNISVEKDENNKTLTTVVLPTKESNIGYICFPEMLDASNKFNGAYFSTSECKLNKRLDILIPHDIGKINIGDNEITSIVICTRFKLLNSDLEPNEDMLIGGEGD